MKKKSKDYFQIKVSTFVWIIVGILFFVWLLRPVEEYEDFEYPTYVEEKEEISDQFSHNSKLHWGHMPITYSYEEDCVGPIIDRIEWAFDVIENDTTGAIHFQKIDDSADINFICYSEQNRRAGIGSTIYTQGQAYIDDTKGNVIIHSTIEFWSISENTRPESCYNFPRLELQEILHVFNFDHVEDNPYSIMYPYGVGCVAKDVLITRNGKTFIPKDELDSEIAFEMMLMYG